MKIRSRIGPSKCSVHMYPCLSVGSRIKPPDEDQVGLELIYPTLKMCIPIQVSGLESIFMVKIRSRIDPSNHLMFVPISSNSLRNKLQEFFY
jgi:hypothetical protein